MGRMMNEAASELLSSEQERVDRLRDYREANEQVDPNRRFLGRCLGTAAFLCHGCTALLLMRETLFIQKVAVGSAYILAFWGLILLLLRTKQGADLSWALVLREYSKVTPLASGAELAKRVSSIPEVSPNDKLRLRSARKHASAGIMSFIFIGIMAVGWAIALREAVAVQTKYAKADPPFAPALVFRLVAAMFVPSLVFTFLGGFLGASLRQLCWKWQVMDREVIAEMFDSAARVALVTVTAASLVLPMRPTMVWLDLLIAIAAETWALVTIVCTRVTSLWVADYVTLVWGRHLMLVAILVWMGGYGFLGDDLRSLVEFAWKAARAVRTEDMPSLLLFAAGTCLMAFMLATSRYLLGHARWYLKR